MITIDTKIKITDHENGFCADLYCLIGRKQWAVRGFGSTALEAVCTAHRLFNESDTIRQAIDKDSDK